MEHIASPTGATVSYLRYGRGPALVLVHGAFSDHDTNWEFVKPLFERHFTVYALARRGRGETRTPADHTLEDEGADVAALIRAIGAPVFLLGHSYGAQTALEAAARIPQLVRKLVLYEAPWPSLADAGKLAPLEALAAQGQWGAMAEAFFRDVLSVPVEDLRDLQATPQWPPIVADAQSSLADLRALSRHRFQPEGFTRLPMPVLLQIGTESPRALYVTDALAAALPQGCIQQLAGQAHEGMTTAPAMYAQSVTRFLLA